MKKDEVNILVNQLSKFRGERLQNILRAGALAMFQFGDYIEKDFHKYSKGEIISTEKKLVPRLAVHTDCFFRLSCRNDIILSRGDIFQPSDKLMKEEDFDFSQFEWTGPYGSNRFEEIVGRYFNYNIYSFIVKNIKISKLGDLIINFENGFILEIFPDVSGNEECWRFFEIGSDKHFIVNGQGLEEDELEADN